MITYKGLKSGKRYLSWIDWEVTSKPLVEPTWMDDNIGGYCDEKLIVDMILIKKTKKNHLN